MNNVFVHLESVTGFHKGTFSNGGTIGTNGLNRPFSNQCTVNKEVP